MALPTPKFLGQGWAFPPRFDVTVEPNGTSFGQAAMVSGDEDIRESLRILLLTIRGERILHPRYGFGVQEHVFDPTDETTLSDLQSQIEDSIIRFEPRIKLQSVEINANDATDGVLMLAIDYFIPSINARSNMVFPFYFREATAISSR